MGEVVAIGSPVALGGFALAGVQLVAAKDEADVRAAWEALPATATLVILDATAAAALASTPGGPLRVVLPS